MDRSQDGFFYPLSFSLQNVKTRRYQEATLNLSDLSPCIAHHFFKMSSKSFTDVQFTIFIVHLGKTDVKRDI